MRAQEATPLLLALGRRQQREDVEQEEQQQEQQQQTSRRSRSNNNAGTTTPTPPRAARRRSQSPRLAVIHEVGPVHERNSSSSFSFSTPDVYENYNTLSTQVVWPPANVLSWPPGGTAGDDQRYSPTLSSSSSSSSLPDDDDVEEGDNNTDGGVTTYQRPSYRTTSRKLRNIQFLVICTMMVSIPFVGFVSIMHQQQSFDSPLNNDDSDDNNNKGGTISPGGHDGDNFIPYQSYTSRHHRHFHRIVEKSHLTNVNRTDSTANAAAFDISTIPKNISFGELASLMVPFYFQNSVDLCISTIVPNSDSSSTTSDGDYSPTSVLPGEVFELRKTILKTRDLFDIFSPVYPRKLRLLGRQKTDEEEDNMPGGERKMKKKKGRDKHQRNDKEKTLHKTKKNNHSVVDVWKILRRFLDDGYMLLGDFQDLNHAKISYTPERLHQYQLQVWNWKEEFVAFVAQNHEGIMDYLSHACPSEMEKQEQELSLANIKKSSSSQSQRKGKVEEREQTPSRSCSYTHSKSSHLFWGQTPSSQRPDGNADEASMVLSRLCSTQLSRALVYLNQVLAVELVVDDKAVNKDVHEIYHNLRKEIRSFLDIVDLFEQQLLFADSKIEQYKEGVSLLKKTKKLLGDLNDEVVAYSKYVEWNEYPEEQEKLKSYISVDWSEFQGWAQEVDLGGKLQSLADDMAHPRSLYSSTQSYDLDSFLVEQKQHPSRDLVIGNDAADADSIVSAICLAFIEGKTPIVPITKDTFVYERPEVELLLELAGISNASTKLLYIEDLIDILQNSDSAEDDARRRLTLVDHNTINDSLHKFRHMFDVVEIVDHHIDEKRYTETCSGKQRTIAFESGKALVGSTTTLVAEELLLDQTDTLLPSIATLLLGVILLDSHNLDESIGKVTYRDRDAVSHLLTETDWSKSALLAYLIPSDEGLTIDTNELFSHLQHAKYEPEFWEAFSVERGLGYDYKAFALGRENEEQQSFGISTILMPGLSFLEKEDFILKTIEFMRSKDIPFLGIMFAYYDLTAGFQRQLAFCSYEDQRLVAMRLYEELGLKEVDIRALELRSNEIQVHLYDQGNIVPSRKQIGPLLIDYFSGRVDV